MIVYFNLRTHKVARAEQSRCRNQIGRENSYGPLGVYYVSRGPRAKTHWFSHNSSVVFLQNSMEPHENVYFMVFLDKFGQKNIFSK